MQNHKPRILIECTPTYSSNLLTGIQRVVRSIVNASQSIKNAEVVPVIWVNGQVYAIQFENGTNEHVPSNGIVSKLLKIQFFIRLKDGLRRNFGNAFIWLRDHYLRNKRSKLVSSDLTIVSLKKDDVLLFLDGSWGRADIAKLTELASALSVSVYYVAYDLIPVTHKDYCDPVKTSEFSTFIYEHLMRSDGIIGISKAVMSDFQRYAVKQYPDMAMPKLDFFHLGVDKHRFVNGDVRQHVKSLFDHKKPTFLMVSTIEPRKNHTYLLDCFEQLWQEGVKVNLLFIGKVGWEVAALMRRINQHPQRNQQFFVFHDANDAELAYAYEHSTALVFPSHAEGFGLPIIEALEHGLPVITSDIQVHREVGGALAMYIDTARTESLVDLVKDILAHGIPIKHQPQDYHWLSWQESAQQLIDRVLEMRKAS